MDIFNIFIQKDNKNRLMKNKMQFYFCQAKWIMVYKIILLKSSFWG